jgi:hypothetical protein
MKEEAGGRLGQEMARKEVGTRVDEKRSFGLDERHLALELANEEDGLISRLRKRIARFGGPSDRVRPGRDFEGAEGFRS